MNKLLGGYQIAVIRQVTKFEQPLISGLCQLLQDSVQGGASIGFLSPLSSKAAAEYWEQVFESLGPRLCLWVAEANCEVLGAVQLAPSTKGNGLHRAEVQKLCVLRSVRGQRISSLLMATAEAHARTLGRTLLVLDTQAGSVAEAVYKHLGWHRVGEIPNYAASSDGSLHATVYFYKQIAS